MDYTVELYKLDKRTKAGMKLVKAVDHENVTLVQMEEMYPRRKGYIVMINETYVVRTNLLTGQEFRERYDTPNFCSPSSESYWSM